MEKTQRFLTLLFKHKTTPPFRLCLLFTFLALCDLSVSDPPYKLCSNTTTHADTSPFQKDLNDLLQTLASNASTAIFHSTSKPGRAYALYMCLGYTAGEKCRDCVAMAVQAASVLCPGSREAVVWQELCQLRYADTDFFGRLDVSGNVPLSNKKNVSRPERFRAVVGSALDGLARTAAHESADLYAVGEAPFEGETVYALTQCTRDLSRNECSECLVKAERDILEKFYFSVGARLLSKSCYLRYEFYAFYEKKPGDFSVSGSRKGGENKWEFGIIAVITVVIVCLAIKLILVAWRRGSLGKMCCKRFGFDNPKSPEFPCVAFASILAATNNFSESNKLGEGGFGPVYKGVLSYGRVVAIKRLSFCSDQGSEEFTNEVLLLMKLQHKNLVKLLGFCVAGEEKLLVYEYMTNSSLDEVLFNRRNTRARLNWTQRKNIICGIARGTLYLHEDSRLRIIHRDLKPSNILLDSDMNPKISDFGMARIFEGSEGQANTATIVGTYGYMSPEYAMEGLYSVKSDVYSFGVLLVEIITGNRNAGFHRTNRAPCLLSYVWRLWHDGLARNLMDPLIADSCEPNEFLSYVHIGLLCIQEDASDRPNMSSVVAMLTSENANMLGQPKRPAFSAGRLTKLGVDESGSINGLTVSSVLAR